MSNVDNITKKCKMRNNNKNNALVLGQGFKLPYKTENDLMIGRFSLLSLTISSYNVILHFRLVASFRINFLLDLYNIRDTQHLVSAFSGQLFLHHALLPL
jgi:hypothetical protein